jgi:hypothetical protein
LVGDFESVLAVKAAKMHLKLQTNLSSGPILALDMRIPIA